MVDGVSDSVIQVEPCDTEFLAAAFIDQFHCGMIFFGSLEIVSRDIGTEDASRQVIVFEERRTGKANEGRIGQGEPHVASKSSPLRPVCLVRNRDDVIAHAVGFSYVLVEFVNQAEHEAVILLEDLFQNFAGTGSRCFVIDHAATDKGPPDLIVQVFAVGHDDEREVPRHDAPHFLREEGHRVRLAASLCMPEDTQPAEVGMGAFDQRQLDRSCHLSIRGFESLLLRLALHLEFESR